MPRTLAEAFAVSPFKVAERYLELQLEEAKRIRNQIEATMPNIFVLAVLDTQINWYLTLMQSPALCFGFQEHPHPHLRISHSRQ
jgi:hypothetical protein